MIGSYHAMVSLEGWIALKTDNPKTIYKHAAYWVLFNKGRILFLIFN